MNHTLVYKPLMGLALVVLLVSDGVLFWNVAANRRGTPESLVVLTQRELARPYRYFKEDSSITLQLQWRVLNGDDATGYSGRWATPDWLNREKLAALGFTGLDSNRQPVERQVFVALEYDGSSYAESVKRAKIEAQKVGTDEAAARRLERETTSASRLFVIDASLDPIELRKLYPDTTTHIITRGRITVWASYRGNKRPIRGRISRLAVERIYVPRHLMGQSGKTESFRKADTSLSKSAYQVTLAYGRRYEPYVMAFSEKQ